jgi:hypothetical protein
MRPIALTAAALLTLIGVFGLIAISGDPDAAVSAQPLKGSITKPQETPVARNHARLTPRQRVMHELTEFAILTAYLYVTLGSVILMKASVLHDQGVGFVPWGTAILKAAVLAKFMLVGRAMKIGERYSTRPLIWPTLHKAAAFLMLLVVLTIIEEVVVGLIHHQSVATSLEDLTGAKLDETLAGVVILFMVLIPYFAIRVLSEALGEGTLTRMFFVERQPVAPK